MKRKLIFAAIVITGILITGACTKKDAVPVQTDIVSWIKPIVYGNHNIAVQSLTGKADGGYLASGMISYYDNSNTDGFVINLNTNGDTIWCRKVAIEDFPNAEVLYAVQNNDNGIIVAGLCSYSTFKRSRFIGWLDDKGNLTSHIVYPLADNEVVDECKIIPLKNGNFYLITNGNNGLDQYILSNTLNFELLKKDGRLIRDKVYKGIQTMVEHIYLVNNDHLVIVGSMGRELPDNADFLFKMVDSTGKEIYSRSFGTTGYDIGYSACPNYQGGFVMSGMATNLSRPYVYPINSDGVVSNRIVIDDNLYSYASIILADGNSQYNMIIQSSDGIYFKKLGKDFTENESDVLPVTGSHLYKLRVVIPQSDGSLSLFYYNGGPVIIRTIPLR